MSLKPPTVIPVPSVIPPEISVPNGESNDDVPEITDSDTTESDPAEITPTSTTEKTYPKRNRTPVIRYERK